MSLHEPDGSSRGRPAPTRRKGQAARAKPGERMRCLWAKAQIASQSARLLLERGDTDGAINRAYYAVFGGARATLASIRSSLALSKTHGTIFRRFEEHLVEGRGFDPALGRALLIKQMSARHAADYREAQVDEATARELVGDMERFLAAVEPFLGRVKR